MQTSDKNSKFTNLTGNTQVSQSGTMRNTADYFKDSPKPKEISKQKVAIKKN